jgi:hypothetical protein
MKRATGGRIGGAIELLIGIPTLYYAADYFYGICTGNYPLGWTAGIMAIAAPCSLVLIADGVTDMVKGTHHYLQPKLMKKFTKSEKTRAELDQYIIEMLGSRDAEF